MIESIFSFIKNRYIWYSQWIFFWKNFNPLMPVGNKKVFILKKVSVCVTFLLPPGIKGLTQQTFVVMKTSLRRLEDVFRLRLQKKSSSRLDQDEYIHLTDTSSEDVFKTSWSRLTVLSWPYVFKTFSRHLQDMLPRRL